MRKRLVVLAIGAALCGCVTTVDTRPDVVVVRPAAPVVVATEDYVGNGQPLYFDAYPGITFYQRWDAVGCNCIIPVAFFGGMWISYLGEPVVYGGSWRRPPLHVINAHREQFRRNPQMFHRAQGRPFAARPHAAPTHQGPGSAQQHQGQVQQHQPHTAAPGTHASGPAANKASGKAVGPQRPPARPPAKAPAKAPAKNKKCPADHKNC